MWGELRKLRSNAAIRISLLYYSETNLKNCENCEAMQQFVYHYYTTGKQICRIAKVAKQRSNSYIIIYTTEKQTLRIAKVAQQCSNSYIINYIHREGLYEHYKA